MSRVLAGLLIALVAAVPASAAPRAKTRLNTFADCGELVSYATRNQDRYRPGGPPPMFTPGVVVGAPAPTGAAGPGGGEVVAAPAPSAPAADSGGGFSLTNNQETGVYEPDIVKTDGKTLYALTSAGVLNVVDVRSAPELLGTLEIGKGYGHQMLFDRRSQQLLVYWTDYQGVTRLAYVDISDPAAPAFKRALSVDGSVVSARRTEGTVRMVLAIRPPEFVAPQETDERRARAWLPRATFVSGSGRVSERRLLGCKSVRRTPAFAGLEQLTVLTINFAKGLDPVDADSVMTGAETVYASADNLYVATQRYRRALEQSSTGPVPSGVTSQVHRFSLDDADNTTYRGSGTVPGFALNQFSLSEHEGVLRVATTDTPPWFGPGTGDSQSYVTTLAADGDRLRQLGQVGGLGKGERIFAVRFLGDTGYVVTFRQVDPLYTIDLSDPAAPAVLGELKIPGFSSYLHPVAGDRLVGVGTGPDEATGDFGLQVSLFDVSDLAAPRLEQRVTFDNGSSEVAYDHHAFLWWQPRELAVLPVESYPDPQPCPPNGPCAISSFAPNAAAVGLVMRPAGVAEAGRVDHGGAVVRRSIVIGDRLVTLSDAGVKASSLDTWAESGFAAFGGG